MFCQNDPIHNNLYLVVWNCNEIGKVYQVTEKWVFFKLLLQPYKQTHLGVRITYCIFSQINSNRQSYISIQEAPGVYCLNGNIRAFYVTVFSCLELFWAVLSCFELFWAVWSCFELFWSVTKEEKKHSNSFRAVLFQTFPASFKLSLLF